jgi:heme/copper-type cytochrome/quinol oxidase subunit 2
LEKKSKKLEEGADIMRKDAKELESTTWWRNIKFTIIIIVIVIVVILIIVLSITLSGNGNSNQPTVNNSTTIIQNGTNTKYY